ncbi:hypothetical protein [Mycobacterium avium]|uniref:hypothetical protein n=1 Tax=Mycobacterium avium TaxID=1764 RepID=UPI000BB0C31F|nr:hypothetical protein [Mycobacterium avium]PBA42253.1 hypothetical protein CKJ63_07350 [Mycobacterium avium]PBA86036.1 hypothetical protein CKJ72_00215 [Mycobacterium avium]
MDDVTATRSSDGWVGLYAAAAYWSIRSTESAKSRLSATKAMNLATGVRRLALRAGIASGSLDGAETYARDCISQGEKPQLAGTSFSDFCLAHMDEFLPPPTGGVD